MSEGRKYDLDWSTADPAMANLILKQAELHLTAQLQIALAADQRALITGGILAGFAATLIAGILAYWTSALFNLLLGCCAKRHRNQCGSVLNLLGSKPRR